MVDHLTCDPRPTARACRRVPLQTCRRRSQGPSPRASESACQAPFVTIYLLTVRAYPSPDGVPHLLQFTTTCHILRRRISGPNTRIVRQMVLITIFATRRWARPTSRMPAAYSRHMLSHATCSPMLVLCLIHSSSVKRFRPPHLGPSSTVDGYGFSSSGTPPDFPASCFHSRHLSSIRKLHFVFRSC